GSQSCRVSIASEAPTTIAIETLIGAPASRTSHKKAVNKNNLPSNAVQSMTCSAVAPASSQIRNGQKSKDDVGPVKSNGASPSIASTVASATSKSLRRASGVSQCMTTSNGRSSSSANSSSATKA